MSEDFFKFPSTPHLAALGDLDIRRDKVLSEAERDDFLRHELTVEEKVDGANLGISFDANATLRVQNRGAYLHLPGTGQWKKLETWLAPRTDTLFEYLADRYILFGEWCYAQHSVHYDHLPDWFLGFDLYDKQAQRFFSTIRRDYLLPKMNIAQAPVIARGHFTLSELKSLLAQSKLGIQPAEGLYLRFDEHEWLGQRAKLVRPAFIQSVGEHWSRSAIQPNRLSMERPA